LVPSLHCNLKITSLVLVFDPYLAVSLTPTEQLGKEQQHHRRTLF